MKRTRKSPNLNEESKNPMVFPDLDEQERKDITEYVKKKFVIEKDVQIMWGQTKKTYCGIDNGVTGGVTILSDTGTVLLHIKTPVKKHLSYTKKKAFINRIDFPQLKIELEKAGEDTFCYIERPMINPGRWVASVSAIRCLEATEILLEELQIPFQFLDSKEWQKALLPSGLIKDELKRAADDVSKRLFPKLKVLNTDCLLIAEYCRRKNSK